MFSDLELREFDRGFIRLADILARLHKAMLTDREQAFFELGLRGSHIEESLMLGDHERARAHFLKALEIMRRL